MDSKTVLLAIEEGEKWRSRRTRLSQKLGETQARRRALEAKLARIQKELGSLGAAMAGLTRQEATSDTAARDVIR